MRASMDEAKLQELADSIRHVGILQPLIVTPIQDGAAADERAADAAASATPAVVAQRYRIVVGHRRYLASGIVGLDELPCLILDRGRVTVAGAMFAENIYREDVTAAEEAAMFADLVEQYKYDEAALCRAVGKPPAYIYARLKLLDGCPEVFQANAQRKINFGVAQLLNTVQDLGYRRLFLNRAIEAGASLRQLKMWVDGYRESMMGAQPAAPQPDNAAHPAAVPAPALDCFVCGRDDAPYNLALIYVCRTEIAWLDDVLRKAGVKGEHVALRV